MSNTIYSKTKTSIMKIFSYLIIINLLLGLFWILIFTTSINSPYTDSFKNKWNKNYIENNSQYIKENVEKYNIKYSKNNECDITWFYNKENQLYFCYDNTVYIFPENQDLKQVITSKKDILLKYFIYTSAISFLSIFILFFINRQLFYKGAWIRNISEGANELDNVIDEISEYIKNKWTRLDYRINTLESLSLSLIDEEIDFYNRFSFRIMELSIEAKKNHLINTSDRLYILYKELQKKYFLEKRMYLHALSNELSLISSKYNTSMLWFVVWFILLIIVSAIWLDTLFAINGNELWMKNSLIEVINIFTFRDISIQTIHTYQEVYITSIKVLSYIYFILFIKILSNKRI